MNAGLRDELEALDRLSKSLDAQYRIPFTAFRFGWDSILGLVPGVGDAVALAPSVYLIYRANALGARKRTIGRMALNTGLDFTIGAVPVVGDVFDAVYKSNRRNFALLKNDVAHRTSVES